MIYDIIDISKITLGEKQPFTNDETKSLSRVYYNDSDLVFSLKNAYFEIGNIEENNYGKQYVVLNSQKLLNEISKICDFVGANKITEVRASITPQTKITDVDDKVLSINKLSNSKVLVAVSIPTFYQDNENIYLQINLKEAVVISENLNFRIQYDLDSLSQAI